MSLEFRGVDTLGVTVIGEDEVIAGDKEGRSDSIF